MCLEFQVLSLKVSDKINIKTVEDLQGCGLLWRPRFLSNVVIGCQEVEQFNFLSGHKTWWRLPLTPDRETNIPALTIDLARFYIASGVRRSLIMTRVTILNILILKDMWTLLWTNECKLVTTHKSLT